MFVEIPNGVFLDFLARVTRDERETVKIDVDSFNELKWEVEKRSRQRDGIFLKNNQIFAVKNGKKTLLPLTTFQEDFLKEVILENPTIDELKDRFWRNSQTNQPIYNLVNRINNILLETGFSLVNENRRIVIV